MVRDSAESLFVLTFHLVFAKRAFLRMRYVRMKS